LKWKEKLIQFWVDANLNFGVRVTSPIEGCHAILKSYLKASTRDLKSVFDRLILFWPHQQQGIRDVAAQEQNKVKHQLNKPYFHMVQSLVCDRALLLILIKVAKLHKHQKENANLGLCTCTIKQSIGLLCFYTVFERFSANTSILPKDIHPFWWYKRLEPSTPSAINVQLQGVVLKPAVVQGKGRPKGAKGKKSKNHGITGMSYTFKNTYITIVINRDLTVLDFLATRKDPLAFEYVTSSSSAIAVLSRPRQRP
jgi:hypothetical protein